MATFRNYEPRSEGLNAAYDLLLRAELAKAQAMGGAFAPLTDAIRSGQQMKIARDEQARLKQAQAEDSALRTQRMGLDTRELDLREKTLNRSIAQDDVMARAIAGIDAHFGGGTPFQGPSAAMGQRTPLSAGGLLGGGHVDPATLAAMGPENASRYMTMQNTIADNQRADAKIAYDQQAETSEQKAYADYLKGLEKELPPEMIPGYKARMLTKEGRSKGYEEIGKYMGEKGKAARENTEFETYRTNMLKEWKKAYGTDPKKMGEVADIETWSKGLPGTPEEKRKAWDSRAEKLMGIGKEAKEAPGIDLPGIGQNLTLNTSLDRRKDGGAAYSVKDGQVVGLSDAEAGELNRLVDTATSRDRLFDDSLMMVIAGDKLPPEYQKNLDAAREVQRAKVRKDILDQLGWQEVDARWAGAEGGQAQSVAGGPSDDPGQNIANTMLKAVAEGKVANDPAAMQKYLEENFTPTALRKVMGRSEAAANAAREDKIRKALAEGPGHKPPVKKLPSVGDAPPSWGKDQ